MDHINNMNHESENGNLNIENSYKINMNRDINIIKENIKSIINS